MNKINSYADLIVERKRLEGELLSQKIYIKNSINSIRERMAPLTKVVNFVGGFKSRPGNTLLKLGTDVGIDLLARQKLAKAGWLTKLFLPLVLKFTASKTIDNIRKN